MFLTQGIRCYVGIMLLKAATLSMREAIKYCFQKINEATDYFQFVRPAA